MWGGSDQHRSWRPPLGGQVNSPVGGLPFHTDVGGGPEQRQKLATPPGGQANIRSWWPPMPGQRRSWWHPMMTNLPRGSLPHPVVSLPLSTAGGNLHAQLGCQAAEIRWYLAVLSSLTPHCPLSTARDPVSQHSKGGRQCPLSTARDHVSQHSKGDMQKNEKKTNLNLAHNLPGTPPTDVQSGHNALWEFAKQLLQTGAMLKGVWASCFTSDWWHRAWGQCFSPVR